MINHCLYENNDSVRTWVEYSKTENFEVLCLAQK